MRTLIDRTHSHVQRLCGCACIRCTHPNAPLHLGEIEVQFRESSVHVKHDTSQHRPRRHLDTCVATRHSHLSRANTDAALAQESPCCRDGSGRETHSIVRSCATTNSHCMQSAMQSAACKLLNLKKTDRITRQHAATSQTCTLANATIQLFSNCQLAPVPACTKVVITSRARFLPVVKTRQVNHGREEFVGRRSPRMDPHCAGPFIRILFRNVKIQI